MIATFIKTKRQHRMSSVKINRRPKRLLLSNPLFTYYFLFSGPPLFTVSSRICICISANYKLRSRSPFGPGIFVKCDFLLQRMNLYHSLSLLFSHKAYPLIREFLVTRLLLFSIPVLGEIT